MGVRKRYQAFVLGILLTFVVGMYVGRQQQSFYASSGANPAGHVHVVVWRDGEVVYEYGTHNLITTIGCTQLRDFLGWANHTMTTCDDIALSNDASPSESWTKLPGEITLYSLDRATGTATVVNSTAYQVTYTWTASGGPQSIQCTGLHWSAVDESDNNLLAAATISSVTLQANDKLQVTWTVNIPDG